MSSQSRSFDFDFIVEAAVVSAICSGRSAAGCVGMCWGRKEQTGRCSDPFQQTTKQKVSYEVDTHSYSCQSHRSFVCVSIEFNFIY